MIGICFAAAVFALDLFDGCEDRRLNVCSVERRL